MAHMCNYYCQGTVHAFQVLAPATLSLAEQTEQLRRLMASRGYHLLTVRPAPEADIEAWRSAVNVTGYVDKRGAHVGSPSAFVGRMPQVPLIAFVDTAPTSKESSYGTITPLSSHHGLGTREE